MLARNPLPPTTVGVSPGRRKRGYFIDAMVAFFAAAALTALYVSLVAWAQQPMRGCFFRPMHRGNEEAAS
jgi:hypothetical protein